MNRFGAVFAVSSLSLLFVGACSSGSSQATPPLTPPSRANQMSRVTASGAHLYAANASSISVYAPDGSAPIRTITNGVNVPSAMAFDRSGNLYVANDAKGANSITIYSPSGGLLRTIRMGIDQPYDVAFNSKGDLFVSNNLGRVGNRKLPGSVTVYAPGETSPVQTITDGLITPRGLAFDSSGRLYVAGCCEKIQVYGPGKAAPYRTLVDVQGPGRMAFSSSGYLFVANAGLKYYCQGFIDKYAPRAVKPSLSFNSNGYSCGPFYTLVLDQSGNLYVPSTASNSVDVYTARNGKRRYTLSGGEGINNPLAVAVGSEGSLYVANDGSITIYKPGETKPSHTITAGISGQVYALAFGP